MNRKYLIILLISSVLLSLESKRFNYSNKSFYKRRPQIKISLPSCKSIECKLELAINTGIKKFRKDEIKPYKDLHLLHLFTPSGLHLIPISFFAKFVLNRYFHLLFILGGYLILFGSNNLMSLERIFSLKLFYLLGKNMNFNFSIISVFIVAMIFNFLSGNYQTSPLSFTFSFLFLGSVVSGNSFKEVSKNLYTSNLLVAYFFTGSVNFISPFIGILVSSVFTFLYPFIFINFWILRRLFRYDLDFFIRFFHLTIEKLHLFSSHINSVELSIGMILLSLLIRINKKASLLLLLVCLDLNQGSFQSMSKEYYKRVEISR